MLLHSPEDSEHEVSCMQSGIGTLRVIPSIWGRKLIHSDYWREISDDPQTQTGLVVLETAKMMLSGWTSNWRTFCRF